MANDTVYVVADGVTVYANGEEFYSGEEITADDVGSLSLFRSLLAAGKIVEKGDDPPTPEPEDEWDYVSIDEALDEKSPNPVSNRAVTKAIEEIEAGIVDIKTMTAEEIDALFA